MKYARFANRLLIFNWRPVLIFEIFYKFLILAGFTPLIKHILYITMDYAGIKYIGNDTISKFLLDPVVLVVLFFILLSMMYITFFDMIAIIQAMDASYHNKKITFGQMLRKAFFKSSKVFLPKNWRFLIYILLVMPATGILGNASYIQSWELPGFILDYAKSKWFLHFGFIAAAIVMLFFSFKWAFSIHFYTLEDDNYKSAVIKSSKMMKGNVPRTIIYMLARYIRIAVFIAVVVFAAGASAFLLRKFGMVYDPNGTLIFNTVIWTIYLIIMACSVIFVPIAYSLLSALYYGYKKENDTGKKQTYSSLLEPSGEYKEPTRLKNAATVFICIGLGVLVAWQFTFGSLSNYDISSIKPSVVAHRGDSINAPENSYPAVEASIEQELGWVEIDVHQTKDGIPVVTHDSNIQRICKVNANVYDLTYEELASYDSGSWFSSDFKGLHISTLEEILELCRDKIHIQIELKPTGHEENLEQNVIDLIYKYNMQDKCAITSLNNASLKKCRELAPDITLLYIMVVAGGNPASLDYVDGFCIEASFATDSIIKRIHSANKLCYVWTVNDANKVWPLLENNVDGIITDYPLVIQKEIDAYYGNDPVRSVLNALNVANYFKQTLF